MDKSHIYLGILRDLPKSGMGSKLAINLPALEKIKVWKNIEIVFKRYKENSSNWTTVSLWNTMG